MEPVFMVLGESASAIASLAIDQNQAVQSVPYEDLKKVLVESKQVLDFE
jgi:hypothetical protein